MIEVSLTIYFLVPLVLHLALLGALWSWESMSLVARRSHHAPSRLYRCAVCDHVYAEARDVPMARCNRCGNLNESIRR